MRNELSRGSAPVTVLLLPLLVALSIVCCPSKTDGDAHAARAPAAPGESAAEIRLQPRFPADE